MGRQNDFRRVRTCQKLLRSKRDDDENNGATMIVGFGLMQGDADPGNQTWVRQQVARLFPQCPGPRERLAQLGPRPLFARHLGGCPGGFRASGW
jgi:hypothetical protein